MKKILIVGATGLIGRAVKENLQSDCEVITASQSKADYAVDIADTDSIATMFKAVGEIDGIISAVGRNVVFKSLAAMTRADYQQSLQQKLLGQVDLALQGSAYLTERGSITLTSGIMNHDFVKDGSAAAMVNNALEGFIKAAALDMPKHTRINIISPGFVAESAAHYSDYNQGFTTVSVAQVAQAYRKSVFGVQTGRVYNV